MTPPREEDFFIGWASPSKRLAGFLCLISAFLLAVFIGVSVAVGASRPDPGPGALRGDWGRQTVTGVMHMNPYPTVIVTKGSKRIPEGHTLMLSASSKRGVQGRANKLDGKLVEVSGIILKRGTLDMLQVRGGRNGVKAAKGDVPQTAPDELLGRWRLTGEVCDGKCLAGAMRPGSGLAHKACAILCLTGGVPPVLVTTKPVEGTQFVMLGDKDGLPLGDRLNDFVGQLAMFEGDLVRRGDILIFNADLETGQFIK